MFLRKVKFLFQTAYRFENYEDYSIDEMYLIIYEQWYRTILAVDRNKFDSINIALICSQ